MDEKREILIAGVLLLIIIFLGGLFAFVLHPGGAFKVTIPQKENPVDSNAYFQSVKQKCVDTDGFNQYTKGMVYFLKDIYIDYCEDQTHLNEYYCDNDIPSFKIVTCECQNGRCIK